MINWKTETRKISDLRPNKKNPRNFTEKGMKDLSKSLDKFGVADPIIINTDNEIIGGHARATALKGQDITEVEVRVPDKKLTEKQCEELLIRLNANIAGEWNWEMLANEFDLGDLDDWGLEIPDLEAAEEEPEIEEDEVPEVKKDPFVKKGDVWELGTHRLMCGDSTVISDVEKLMDGQKADMVFTDPPYGISIVSSLGKVGGRKLAKTGDYSPVLGDGSIDVAIDSIGIIKTLNAKVEIIWGGNYYANHLDNSSCWIVWDKENSGNFADAELAWTNQNTATRIFKHMWNGMIKASEHGQSRVHPTQKPIALAAWCFKEYGEADDVVLDLFLGSGSTLIACEQTKRKCFGMELDEHYCSVIITRWLNYMIKENKDITLKCNGEVIDYKEVLDGK